jgi:hypothetical protein
MIRNDGRQLRAKSDRYPEKKVILCYRCGEVVKKLTGGFTNVCDACCEPTLLPPPSPKNAVTDKKTNSDISALENRNKESKICVFCEKEFFPTRVHAKFCSNRCSAAFRMRKHRKQQLELVSSI